MRVMRVRPGDVFRIRAEIFFALATIMNRRNELDIDRASRTRIAEMMQDARPQIVPPRRMPAIGTRTFFKILSAFFDFRLRQIVGVRDPLRRVGHVFTRSKHGNPPLESFIQVRNIPFVTKSVNTNSTIFMIQCPEFLPFCLAVPNFLLLFSASPVYAIIYALVFLMSFVSKTVAGCACGCGGLFIALALFGMFVQPVSSPRVSAGIGVLIFLSCIASIFMAGKLYEKY